MPTCTSAAAYTGWALPTVLRTPGETVSFMAGQVTDFEADAFLTLLTDALRAGPGSRAWTDAVEQLRGKTTGNGAAGIDDYKLLLNAREALASGKDYRQVRAGTGFTRKLFTDLESDSGTHRSKPALPIASIVAVLATIGILAVIALVVWQLVPHTDATQARADELAAAYYPTDITSAVFDQPDSSIPMSFRTIGSLPLTTAGGLHPATSTSTSAAGGGIVVSEPLPTDQPIALEVDLRDPVPSDATVVQVFVSSSNDFSADRGAGSHELVYQVHGKQQQVFVNGNALTAGAPIAPGNQHIRIVFNHDLAAIETGSRQAVWSGAHHLGDPGPRYVGVRFIRADGAAASASAEPSVSGIRISKK